MTQEHPGEPERRQRPGSARRRAVRQGSDGAPRRVPLVFHHSSGAVVARDGRFLLLDTGREWTFPKGHLEEGETPGEAAVREVREETGVKVRLLAPLGATRFAFGQEVSPYLPQRKRVDWYLAEALPDAPGVRAEPTDGAADPPDVVWCAPLDALERLTHRGDREIFEQALAWLEGRASVER